MRITYLTQDAAPVKVLENLGGSQCEDSERNSLGVRASFLSLRYVICGTTKCRTDRVGNMTRPTALSSVRPIPRRGLSRDEAAMYVGISATKFDELVHDGRMPGPRRIDGRKLWDVYALDVAFDSLPRDSDQGQRNSFDDAWGSR
jgi:excisionase family DNA binding protein